MTTVFIICNVLILLVTFLLSITSKKPCRIITNGSLKRIIDSMKPHGIRLMLFGFALIACLSSVSVMTYGRSGITEIQFKINLALAFMLVFTFVVKLISEKCK